MQSINHRTHDQESFTLPLNDPKTTFPKPLEIGSCHPLVNRGAAANVHCYSVHDTRDLRVRGLGCSRHSILGPARPASSQTDAMIIELNQGDTTMKMIAIAGFVFAATGIAALVYDYRTDVLHGPYIEGSDRSGNAATMRLTMAPAIVDHFRWRARNMIYLTAIIAC
jgi:hypothetical protein